MIGEDKRTPSAEVPSIDPELICCEIHDGFVQYAVAAKMLLETALDQLPSDADRAAESLREAQRILEQSILEARRLIAGLQPLALEGGLVGCVEQLRIEQSGLSVAVTYRGELDKLPGLLAGAALRIIQEALANVRKHSGAAAASVRIAQLSDQLELEIRDEGVGFDPDQIPKGRFGLRGITRRAEILGGHAEIHSGPGKGTQILVRLPSRPSGPQVPENSMPQDPAPDDQA